ncbi:MAG TPA: hypothetical protein PK263_06165 [bacterium]|nr:hypothetical protein [bacterium]
MKKVEYFKARELRQKGFSLTEISNRISVAKSTVSGWVKDIVLDDEAMSRLREKVSNGQLKSANIKRAKTQATLQKCYDDAKRTLLDYQIDHSNSRILCSLIYWCEGGKGERRIVQFTNSDPNLMQAFLSLFRSSYKLSEEKFRVCIHLHDYHNKDKQIAFWSKITKIPEQQFIKPFFKINQGKNIHPEYQGCAQIRYCDVKVARDLIMTGQAMIDHINLGA